MESHGAIDGREVRPGVQSGATSAGATTSRRRGGTARAFTSAASSYWLTIFPQVCRELAHWRRRAAAIPDPVLRELASDAFAKRGNVEGAAAFAVLAPRARRTVAVRALVALQAIYNYADLLSEQPAADAVADARRLHEALLAALDLDRDGPDPDWYALHSRRDDGGYLAEMIATCRAALGELPSYPAVAIPARAAVERIVAFQSLSAGERSQRGAPDRVGALELWARGETCADSGLSWWETAAAGGSSLGLHALVARSAEAVLDRREVAAVERAYFPWIGGLHSLMDSVVDEREDADTGQISLLACYASREDARARMGSIADRAMRAARALPRGSTHAVVTAGMVGFYVSASAEAEPVLAGVVHALGPLARPTLLVFDVRHRFARAVAPAHARDRARPTRRRGWREEEDLDARAA